MSLNKQKVGQKITIQVRVALIWEAKKKLYFRDETIKRELKVKLLVRVKGSFSNKRSCVT